MDQRRGLHLCDVLESGWMFTFDLLKIIGQVEKAMGP